jgi:6-phosphogluconolactonase (cycloisomerase 2 family)
MKVTYLNNLHEARPSYSRALATTLFLALTALTGLPPVAGQSSVLAQASNTGAVYTMTNAVTGNEVVAFNRAADGTLSPAGSFPTGGLGSGGGLGNQGGLILDDDRFLFAVNAGSDEISVLSVDDSSLRLVDKVPSGGMRPISLTLDGDLLYVLNAGGLVGGSDNITGFVVGQEGSLSPLAGSTRPLSAAVTGPAQVAFSPSGRFLVVTEKSTNIIDAYSVTAQGTPGPPDPQPSAGQTPFGFAFGRRDQLFVSEAAGGAPGASSVSSYTISGAGLLHVISPSVPTTQTAACWVVVTTDHRFAYVSNTGNASISSYRIGRDGGISLLEAVAAPTGAAPIDMALSRNGHFLYVLNSGDGTLSGYRIGPNGGLTPLAVGVGGLPPSVDGLAGR